MTAEVRPQLSEEQARKFVLDASPWMSCDECFDYLDEFMDLVDPVESHANGWVPAMVAHLAGCGACREEVESLRVLLSSDS